MPLTKLSKVGFKFSTSTETWHGFDFQSLRKSKLQKTYLALTDQIQTWQKIQSDDSDKFSKVEFKFSASTETWHKF